MGGSASSTAFPGFRVLSCLPGGPLDAAGAETFLDHIVEVDGKGLAELQLDDFCRLIQNSEDKIVTITLYNSRWRTAREVRVALSRWSDDPSVGILGAAIRRVPNVLEPPMSLHVISVERGSPAAAAGLNADEDFILGVPGNDFTSSEQFVEYLESVEREGGTANLAVVDKSTLQARIVSLKPQSDWGGVGILGCQWATGVLHALPTVEELEETTPGLTTSSTRRPQSERQTSITSLTSSESGDPAQYSAGDAAAAATATAATAAAAAAAAAEKNYFLLKRQSQTGVDVEELPVMPGCVLFPAPGQLFVVES